MHFHIWYRASNAILCNYVQENDASRASLSIELYIKKRMINGTFWSFRNASRCFRNASTTCCVKQPARISASLKNLPSSCTQAALKTYRWNRSCYILLFSANHNLSIYPSFQISDTFSISLHQDLMRRYSTKCRLARLSTVWDSPCPFTLRQGPESLLSQSNRHPAPPISVRFTFSDANPAGSQPSNQAGLNTHRTAGRRSILSCQHFSMRCNVNFGWNYSSHHMQTRSLAVS